MTAFFTKKQKKQLRERRRRLKRANTGEEKNSEATKGSNKDNSETKIQNTATSQLLSLEDSGKAEKSRTVIRIADNLAPKEAKKIRKDARRRARAQGMDPSELKFIASDKPDGPPVKKRRRAFPCLNDLVQEQHSAATRKREEEMREAAENELPESYKSKYVAVDCEMVGIGSEGRVSALARVSIVDWYGKTILDTFVKVPSRITDFRTHVSGVTPRNVGDGAMDPVECRELVAKILNGKVLVGHALSNDLKALLLKHPKHDIRDTAKYRLYQRYGGSKWRPRKLRDLVKEFLGKSIQEEGQAHDSTIDASSAMELFKLARESWEAEIDSKLKKKS